MQRKNESAFCFEGLKQTWFAAATWISSQFTAHVQSLLCSRPSNLSNPCHHTQGLLSEVIVDVAIPGYGCAISCALSGGCHYRCGQKPSQPDSQNRQTQTQPLGEKCLSTEIPYLLFCLFNWDRNQLECQSEQRSTVRP